MTRGDKLYESRGGEKFYGDTGEDALPNTHFSNKKISHLYFFLHCTKTSLYKSDNISLIIQMIGTNTNY